MPVVSLQWGAWGRSGMAAQDAPLLARLARLGIGAIQPVHGLAALWLVIQGMRLDLKPLPFAHVLCGEAMSCSSMPVVDIVQYVDLIPYYIAAFRCCCAASGLRSSAVGHTYYTRKGRHALLCGV